jgi:DNA-binding Xre family transcriptional regulator
MSQSSPPDFTHLLQSLMQQVGFSSFKALSQKAGVSERQLRRLRQGQLLQMQLDTLLKISQALQVPMSELLVTFGGSKIAQTIDTQVGLQQEYQHLQTQMQQQRAVLMQEFQQSSLQVLESWMLQWPTAAYAAQQNPQLPAVKLLPLVRPVEQLLKQWGVEAIASIGSEVAYDPRWHQMMEGTAQPGEQVKVRYAGYQQGDRLLSRAKVSRIS